MATLLDIAIENGDLDTPAEPQGLPQGAESAAAARAGNRVYGAAPSLPGIGRLRGDHRERHSRIPRNERSPAGDGGATSLNM
jgi:hypothetical protein